MLARNSKPVSLLHVFAFIYPRAPTPELIYLLCKCYLRIHKHCLNYFGLPKGNLIFFCTNNFFASLASDWEKIIKVILECEE